MNIKVITGLCGSGKTFYCKNKENIIVYDEIYSYQINDFDKNKVNNTLNNLDDNSIVYLDAYNNNLLNYIKENYNISSINCVLLYTDLDDYYDCIAINEPRCFQQERYDDYIKSMINTINYINNNVKETFDNISYVYRKNDKYTEYENDEHLNSILNTTKENRLLKYIDETSGAKNYQSILLDDEYIRKGTEQDWLTFENIKKCTTLKDKVVCDTGCFNGYFSFMSLKDGAKKVIGIDHNAPALSICNKIAIYNNYHLWVDGKKNDVSCEYGIHFYEHKIGKDLIFDELKTNPKIDIIFAFNYLHHLKNELGLETFNNTIDSYFKNSKEVIFEINDCEIDDIEEISLKNNFILKNKIESHRKTSFGNRWILYYSNF